MSFFVKAAARLIAALLLAGSLGPGLHAYTMGPYEEQDPGFGSAALKLSSPGEVAQVSPASTAPANSSEFAAFFNKLRTGTIEPACRRAEVKLNENIKIVEGISYVGGGVKRAIRKFPDGKLALVDELTLRSTLGYSRPVLTVPDLAGLGVSVGASGTIEGKSQIVRPIPNRRWCMELLEIVKVYEFKTVLPATMKRVKKMDVGEIWKLPITMSMSFSAGASANVQQAVTISLGYSHTRQAKPSVTLRRLDEKTLRLRLRLDRMKVNSIGVSASTLEVPLDAMGLEKVGAFTAEKLNQYAVPKFAEKWVTKDLFDKALLKEINKYIAFKMSFGHSRYSGKKLLLEYILDLENEEHLRILEEFLRGDFGMLEELGRMGAKLSGFAENDDAEYGLEALDDAAGALADDSEQANTFRGTDIYNGRSSNAGLVVPVVGDYSANWGKSYHRYQSGSYGGATIHVHERTKNTSNSSLNVPFVGTMFRHNTQRSVIVLNRETTGGDVSEPVLLYQHYDGLINRGSSAAGKMIEEANGMLRYVGARGEGTSGVQIPSEELLGEKKRYDSAALSFKLLISENGIRDIITAPAETLVRAFMNVMRETYADIIDKAMHLFGFNRKGEVVYDRDKAMSIFGVSEVDVNDSMNPVNVIDYLVWGATAMIKDLASVREKTGWKDRSERLADVAAGRGKSDMKYEDFFKVVLQMVKPEDVTAQVYVALDADKKKYADVRQEYNFFNAGAGTAATLPEVTQMRDRFAEPSELSD